jgi:hypothetical protein
MSIKSLIHGIREAGKAYLSRVVAVVCGESLKVWEGVTFFIPEKHRLNVRGGRKGELAL